MNLGDRVDRLENGERRGATIATIDDRFARLVYDEGGGGWWPLDELSPHAG